MINEVEIIESLHTKTKRNYIQRMLDEKIHCMDVAQEYSGDYWDGDRRYGYGGYSYDGRWNIVAKKMIEKYGLDKNSKVLDLGCGMGHLLFELKKELGCHIQGLDISSYAKSKSPVSADIQVQDLRGNWSLNSDYDLILSVMTLHNFGIKELSDIFTKIRGKSKNFYFAVESYRTNKELYNLQCWALTCQAFFKPEDWAYILESHHINCDLELLYFE